jgi:hypothetical protein
VTWRPIIWLLAAVLLAGTFVVVFEQGPQSAGISAPIDTPMLGFEPGNVTSLAINTSNCNAVCVLRNQAWFLTQPVETRADGARIRQLLDTLHRTRRRETISAERQQQRGLTMESFGLDQPRARCLVGYDRRQDEIVFGLEAPLGDLVYVRLNAGEDVLAVTRDFEKVLPASLDDLRDHAVFPSTLQAFSRIEIKHAGGFIQLASVGGHWRIQQPKDAPVDPARMVWLLGRLREMRVEAFGGDVPGADPVAYGLGPEEAVIEVTVWPEGVPDGITLTVGKAAQDNPSLCYARISDMGAIGRVGKAAVLPLIGLKIEMLRDRRLCDADPPRVENLTILDGEKKLVVERLAAEGWAITEPIRSKADARAVGLLLKEVCALRGDELQGLDMTNAAARVMQEAVLRLKMAEASATRSGSIVTNGPLPEEPAAKRTWTYWVGTNTVKGSRLVLRQEDQVVFRVLSADLLQLLEWDSPREAVNMADPLRYMDRRVLDLEMDHVRRLTLTRDGREETVVKDVGGNWSVDSPPGAQLAEATVTATLGLAADLVAVRIESVASTNLVRYGFDETSPRLTFGLTGTGGIQKTILMGAADQRQGVYAMVQGQDVIYVLPKSVVEALTRSLVATP